MRPAIRVTNLLVLATLAALSQPAWSADPPATPSPAIASPSEAAALDLPYGAGYEAREAARSARERAAAREAAAESPRPDTSARERPAARGADRPRSSTRPPRPERSR